MKTLSLIIMLFVGVTQADGDFGEGGGPKVIKAGLYRNNELSIYRDRIEYASLLDNLAFKSVDQKFEQLDYEKVMRLNLLRTQYMNDPKKVAESIKEGETFNIDRSKVSKQEFALLELKTIIKYYTDKGRKISAEDVCEYLIKIDKTKKEIPTIGHLVQLNLCGSGRVINVSEIAKVKVEFRK